MSADARSVEASATFQERCLKEAKELFARHFADYPNNTWDQLHPFEQDQWIDRAARRISNV